jgi:hypothetical protein
MELPCDDIGLLGVNGVEGVNGVDGVSGGFLALLRNFLDDITLFLKI